jgi:hypothetical protein
MYLQPDPLAQQGPFEQPVYAYALSNPLTQTDPTGLDVFAYDDGTHAAVAFTIECGTCEEDPVVVRIDYSCQGYAVGGSSAGGGCLLPSESSVVVSQGTVSGLQNKDENVIRCEADCETTRAAMAAAAAACAQPYSALNTCRDTVRAALAAANCPLIRRLP